MSDQSDSSNDSFSTDYHSPDSAFDTTGLLAQSPLSSHQLPSYSPNFMAPYQQQAMGFNPFAAAAFNPMYNPMMYMNPLYINPMVMMNQQYALQQQQLAQRPQQPYAPRQQHSHAGHQSRPQQPVHRQHRHARRQHQNDSSPANSSTPGSNYSPHSQPRHPQLASFIRDNQQQLPSNSAAPSNILPPTPQSRRNVASAPPPETSTQPQTSDPVPPPITPAVTAIVTSPTGHGFGFFTDDDPSVLTAAQVTRDVSHRRLTVAKTSRGWSVERDGKSDESNKQISPTQSGTNTSEPSSEIKETSNRSILTNDEEVLPKADEVVKDAHTHTDKAVIDAALSDEPTQLEATQSSLDETDKIQESTEDKAAVVPEVGHTEAKADESSVAVESPPAPVSFTNAVEESAVSSVDTATFTPPLKESNEPTSQGTSLTAEANEVQQSSGVEVDAESPATADERNVEASSEDKDDVAEQSHEQSPPSVVSSTTIDTLMPITEANKPEIQIEIAEIEVSEPMSDEQPTTKAAVSSTMTNVFDLPSLKAPPVKTSIAISPAKSIEPPATSDAKTKPSPQKIKTVKTLYWPFGSAPDIKRVVAIAPDPCRRLTQDRLGNSQLANKFVCDEAFAGAQALFGLTPEQAKLQFANGFTDAAMSAIEQALRDNTFGSAAYRLRIASERARASEAAAVVNPSTAAREKANSPTKNLEVDVLTKTLVPPSVGQAAVANTSSASAFPANPDWLDKTNKPRFWPRGKVVLFVDWVDAKRLKKTAASVNKDVIRYASEHPQLFKMGSAAEVDAAFSNGFTTHAKVILNAELVIISRWVAEQLTAEAVNIAERSRKAAVEYQRSVAKGAKKKKTTATSDSANSSAHASASAVLDPAASSATESQYFPKIRNFAAYHLGGTETKWKEVGIDFDRTNLNSTEMTRALVFVAIQLRQNPLVVVQKYKRCGIPENFLNAYLSTGKDVLAKGAPAALESFGTEAVRLLSTPIAADVTVSQASSSADASVFELVAEDMIAATDDAASEKSTKSTLPKRTCYAGAATEVSLQSMNYVPLATMTKPVWVEVPTGLEFALRMIDTGTLVKVAVFAKRRRASQPIVDPFDTFMKEGVPYDVLQKYLKSTHEKFTPFKVEPSALTGTSSPPPMDTSSADGLQFVEPSTESASSQPRKSRTLPRWMVAAADDASVAPERSASVSDWYEDDYINKAKNLERKDRRRGPRSASATGSNAGSAASESSSPSVAAKAVKKEKAPATTKLPVNYGQIPEIILTDGKPRNMTAGLLYQRVKEATPEEVEALRQFQIKHVQKNLSDCIRRDYNTTSDLHSANRISLARFLNDPVDGPNPKPDPDTPALPPSCWLPPNMRHYKHYGEEGRKERLSSDLSPHPRSKLLPHEIAAIEGGQKYGAAYFRFNEAQLKDMRRFKNIDKLDLKDFITVTETITDPETGLLKAEPFTPAPAYHRVIKVSSKYPAYRWSRIQVSEKAIAGLVELAGWPEMLSQVTAALMAGCNQVKQPKRQVKLFAKEKDVIKIELPKDLLSMIELIENGQAIDWDAFWNAYWAFIARYCTKLVFYSCQDIENSATNLVDPVMAFDEENQYNVLNGVASDSSLKYSSSRITFVPTTPSPVVKGDALLATFEMLFEGVQAVQTVAFANDEAATAAENIIYEEDAAECPRHIEHADKFYDFRILSSPPFDIPVGFHVQRAGDLMLYLEGCRRFVINVGKTATLSTSWYYASTIWLHTMAQKFLENSLQWRKLREEEAAREKAAAKAAAALEVEGSIKNDVAEEEGNVEAADREKEEGEEEEPKMKCDDKHDTSSWTIFDDVNLYSINLTQKPVVRYKNLRYSVSGLPSDYANADLRCGYFPVKRYLLENHFSRDCPRKIGTYPHTEDGCDEKNGEEKKSAKRKHEEACSSEKEEEKREPDESSDDDEALAKKPKITRKDVATASSAQSSRSKAGGKQANSSGGDGKTRSSVSAQGSRKDAKRSIKNEPFSENEKKKEEKLKRVGSSRKTVRKTDSGKRPSVSRSKASRTSAKKKRKLHSEQTADDIAKALSTDDVVFDLTAQDSSAEEDGEDRTQAAHSAQSSSQYETSARLKAAKRPRIRNIPGLADVVQSDSDENDLGSGDDAFLNLGSSANLAAEAMADSGMNEITDKVAVQELSLLGDGLSAEAILPELLAPIPTLEDGEILEANGAIHFIEQIDVDIVETIAVTADDRAFLMISPGHVNGGNGGSMV